MFATNDANGHSYIVDGETVYVTVYGTTSTLTIEEAREWWTLSSRIARANKVPATAESLEQARRSLHGW